MNRALLACLLLTACQGSVRSIFPPGLAPLDDPNMAELPADGSETFNVVHGSTKDYVWAHGKGYVLEPIETTWAAMRDHDVSVDRKQVTKWTVDMDGVEPDYLYSYVVHDEVDSIVTVKFDITWRHDVVEGTADAPMVVGGRFQKTAGSTFITTLAGSLSATKIDDNTTEIEMEEHLNALQEGDEPQSFLNDWFASVVAKAHGQPLP